VAADSQNHQVVIYGSTGTVLQTWGTYGPEPGQLSAPADVTVTSDGRIAVCDTGNNRIQFFNETGTFLGKFGRFSAPFGATANAIDVDVQDNIYVAQTTSGLPTVQVFAANGTPLRNFSTQLAPKTFKVGPDGLLYIGGTTALLGGVDVRVVVHKHLGRPMDSLARAPFPLPSRSTQMETSTQRIQAMAGSRCLMPAECFCANSASPEPIPAN
jgi:hypothetical protein